MSILFFSAFALLNIYAVLIIWLHSGYVRYKDTFSSSADKKAVTLIIPFRNEEGNMNVLLDSLMALSYPRELMEILFVDDHSKDSGAGLIQKWLESNPDFNVQLLKLEKDQGKKAALKLAIQNASNDIILQTDADCFFRDHWVDSMMKPFATKETMVVVGTVQMIAKPNSISRMMALEFASLQASGISFAIRQLPIMSNGANLAYRKHVWQESFLQSDKWAGGDDVFFVQEVSKLDKASVVVNKNSIVYTKPPGGLAEFINQRIRWGSKSVDYPLKQGKWVAALVFLINLLFVLLFIAGIFNSAALSNLLLLVLIKASLDYWLMQEFLKDQKASKLLRVFPLLVLAYPFYISYTVLYILLFPSKVEWKGRTIKK